MQTLQSMLAEQLRPIKQQQAEMVARLVALAADVAEIKQFLTSEDSGGATDQSQIDAAQNKVDEATAALARSSTDLAAAVKGS